jgi:signal transduction histidine kinase
LESLTITIVLALLVLLAGVFLARKISDRISLSLQTLSNAGAAPSPATLAAIDIEEVHKLGETLHSAHQQIERHAAERDELRRRIMVAQEQERLRLAHDLHDQTGQSITAALLDLKAIEPFVAEEGRPRLRILSKALNEIGQMLHRIAWELRPASLDELGLTNVLQTYFEEWSRKHGITVDFKCKDPRLDEYSDEIRTTIYRLIQEALNNIARHADATRASAVIETVSGALRLIIRDNGRGFDKSSTPERLGLAGMRERVSLIGGRLEVDSFLGAGTILSLDIPVEEKAPA